MFIYRPILFFIFLIVGFVAHSQRPTQTNYLKYFGVEFSRDYYSRKLIDDAHLVIDTFVKVGVSDQQYISIRNRNDINSWRNHFGIKYGYELNRNYYFESGIAYYRGGVDVKPNLFTDTLLQQIFYSIAQIPFYRNEYHILEIPFLFRAKPAIEDKKNKIFPVFTYGFAIGFATQRMYYYNYVEYNYLGRNIGMTGNIGLALRKETDNVFSEINFFYRPTLINHFAYAAVRSNYNPLGVEIKLGYLFKGKSISTSKFALTCKNFSNKLQRYNLGIFYAANYSSVRNTGTQKTLLTLYQHSEIDTSKVVRTSSDVSGIRGYSAGVYGEFRFNPLFSIGISPSVIQRGFKISDYYEFKNAPSVTVFGLYKYYYIDFSVDFNYRPTNDVKLFVGGVASVIFHDKIYDTKYSPLGYAGSSINNKDFGQFNRTLLYFKEKPRDFVSGVYLGATYEFDNRLALTAKVQHTGNMMHKNLSLLSLSNTTYSLALLFYLSKNEFNRGHKRR